MITKQELADLIDGRLPWERTKSIISGIKDTDRFEKYIEILQEKVAYTEKILVPLSEHLNIVAKGTERIVKCDCGYEFGDWRVNWKLNALIHVLDTKEKLIEVYSEYPGIGDPEYCDVREFYCPGCGSLLEVEAVAKGYPIIFDWFPDIDAFYKDWLGRPLPEEKEYQDLSYEVTSKWVE